MNPTIIEQLALQILIQHFPEIVQEKLIGSNAIFNHVLRTQFIKLADNNDLIYLN